MLRQRPSRVHDHQLVLRFPKDGPRGVEHNSFYIRSIKSWNNPPRNVPAAPSLSIFKERLDSAWINHPLKFFVIKVPWKVGSLQLFGSLPKYNSYFPKYCKLQISIKEGRGGLDEKGPLERWQLAPFWQFAKMQQ